MAVLSLKCYLNDKVVWLHSLWDVILYTFTRLHWETGVPARSVYTGHVSRRGAPPSMSLPHPRLVCAHACCMHVTVTYPRARV